MKIVIKQKEERPHRLILFAPLRVIKWKIVSRSLAKNKNIAMPEDELHETLKSAYKTIKDYVKKNGHFYLVKVDTHDGVHIRIKV